MKSGNVIDTHRRRKNWLMNLRAKGFGVANGVCTEAQSYKSILTKPQNAALDKSSPASIETHEQAGDFKEW
jgi:hypothetical protein